MEEYEDFNDIADENAQDWRYWKGLYYDLLTQYATLFKNYQKVSIRLSKELEKSKNEAIKEKQHKILPALSPINKHASNHTKSSSSGSYTQLTKPKDSSDSTKLYECFLILSGDSEDSSIIFTYTNSDILQWLNTKVITDFVFSSQLINRKIEIGSLSDIFEVLYPQYYRDKHSFVFTLKGNSEKIINIIDVPNKNKDLLYCCCVIVEDLHINKETSEIVSSYLCYCLLTYCPCFELHFEVIYRLLSIKRIERFNKLNKLEDSNLKDLLLLFKEKSPSPEEVFLLETYGVYYIQPLLNIRIDISESEPIEYEFSHDLSFIDTVWPCPLLFSMLSFPQLMTCLFALLQENSIVLYSKNLGLVSSSILGLHSLLKPFIWSYVISPILPEQIKEILQAPLPLLVGVSFTMEKVSPYMMFVNLDEDIEIKTEVFQCKYRELMEKCRKDYELLYGTPCYIPNELQSAACARIIQHIRRYFETIGSRFCGKPEFDHKNVKEVIRKSDLEEQKFLERFVQTQIFIKYIQDKYGL